MKLECGAELAVCSEAWQEDGREADSWREPGKEPVCASDLTSEVGGDPSSDGWLGEGLYFSHFRHGKIFEHIPTPATHLPS